MEIIKNLEVLQFYETYSGDQEMQEYANTMFVAKYIELKEDPNGFNYLERTNYKPGDDPFFIPGKIYTFKNVIEDKKKYDGQPLVLCTKIGAEKKGFYMQGLNFNTLPQEMTARVLDAYAKLFEKEMEQTEDAAGRNESYISKEIVTAFMNNKFLVTVFEKFNSNPFSKFYLGNMMNPTLVETDDWKYIPFIRPMSLVGMSVEDLIKKYEELSKKMAAKHKK